MRPPTIFMRPAVPAERAALESLQRRSSMHEPMYRAQLTAHPDAIEVPAELIRTGAVRIAEKDGRIAGFSALLPLDAGGCELDALFVEPDLMRGGVGSALIEDARRIAHERGAERIDVVANPQAIAFYERVGFTTCGREDTRFGSAPRMTLALES
jgi:GNAT superfamily N-acetyltransferase